MAHSRGLQTRGGILLKRHLKEVLHDPFKFQFTAAKSELSNVLDNLRKNKRTMN